MEISRLANAFAASIFLLALACCNMRNRNSTAYDQLSSDHQASWQRVGPGGGGAVFNPAISPHNANTVFASCDMGGCFETINGGASWRMFNLHSMVDFYIFDPIDSNTIYANSIVLFKTTDHGRSWRALLPRAEDVCGFVCKGDHASEIVVTSDSIERKVLALAVDPNNSAKLYAVVHEDALQSFYTSVDAGLHWNKQRALADTIMNLYIDPSSDTSARTIYFTARHSVTSLNKNVWIQRSIPSAIHRMTQYCAGYDETQKRFIMYGICGRSYNDPKGTVNGIYYSSDGGISWENRQQHLLTFSKETTQLPEWRAIATCASHPDMVYLSYNDLKVDGDSTATGVAKSKDFGRTWTLCWKDTYLKSGEQPSSNVDGGWLDERFGTEWSGNPLSLSVSPTDPALCYASDLGRIIKTTNAGQTWQQVYTTQKDSNGWMSRGIDVTTGYNIAFDPFDERHAYIANTDIGLLESHDGTKSWKSATNNNGIPAAWVNTTYKVIFDPTARNKVWAVMSGTHDLPRPKMWRRNAVGNFIGGIAVTLDGAKTWNNVSDEIGQAAFTDIIIGSDGAKKTAPLFACAFGKGVYRSLDDGKTWQQKNNGIRGKEPFAWRITHRAKDNTLFLLVSRRSEDSSINTLNDGALYRSTDNAEHWTSVILPRGTNAPTSMITESGSTGRLFLSAWGREMPGKFSADVGGGVFISDDDGYSWKQTMSKDQHIYDLTFDSRSGKYYACGFEGSAYESYDRGESWHRIPGFNFKWGKTVQPDPTDPACIYIITFGGSIWHGPASGTPGTDEDITTAALKYR